jgi:hypothetical protein
MPVTRQWLGKCHVIAALPIYTTIEELLKVVFSMQPATTDMSHYNKASIRKGVFCVVRAEAI